jgi:hypothetical protein
MNENQWMCHVHYVPEETSLFPGWDKVDSGVFSAGSPEDASKAMVASLASDGRIHDGADVCIRVRGMTRIICLTCTRISGG